MHVASICIFEGPPPPQEKVAASIRDRLHLVPRYRQRVQRVPLQLARAVWLDAVDFDLDYHLRRTALAAPGATRAADVGRACAFAAAGPHQAAVGDLGGRRADRPRWAMVGKVHHCMVDGVSGTELLTLLLDATPEPPASRAERLGAHRGQRQGCAGGRSPFAGDRYRRAGARRSQRPARPARACPTWPKSSPACGRWPARHVRSATRTHRHDRLASRGRLVRCDTRRRQGGQGGLRLHRERCRPGRHHQRLSPAADLPRRARLAANGADVDPCLGAEHALRWRRNRGRDVQQQGVGDVRRPTGRRGRSGRAPGLAPRPAPDAEEVESGAGG